MKRKIAYQTPKNILKLIFKVVTKHWKIRQFSRKCSLENEQFSKKHQYWNKQSNVSLKHISQLGQQSYGLHVVSHGKTGQNFLTRPNLIQKISDPNSIFFTRKKNRLTRDLTRVFCGSTQPDPTYNPNHFLKLFFW